LWVWIAVIGGIAAVFAVSLVFGRKAHVISVAEASRWVAGYVTLAVLFGIGVWVFAGAQYGGEFFAGYATEYALSIDNLFVFVILLTSFRVPRELQGRVVLIGIMIALVLRGCLIAVGAVLISTFSWVFYLFGVFLVITAWNLAKEKHEDEDASREPGTVALLRRFLPVSEQYNGTKMTIRIDRKRLFTPMFAVILALGVTDLLFALDSIPAIFGLTKEPFLVFTANAFALLGLSELYFLLGALLQRLVYLSKGLALILGFIGLKLISEALATNTLPFVNGGEPVAWAPPISPALSLVVVISILAVTVAASLLASRRAERRAARAVAGGEPGVADPQPAGGDGESLGPASAGAAPDTSPSIVPAGAAGDPAEPPRD
jgi:tellurite resistance protein TerC